MGILTLVRGYMPINVKTAESLPSDQRLLDASIVGTTLANGYRTTGMVFIALGVMLLAL